jgi:hypothetical protein
VVDWFDFGLEEGEDHFTTITIKDLRDGIATKLADPAERQAWAQQVGACDSSNLWACDGGAVFWTGWFVMDHLLQGQHCNPLCVMHTVRQGKTKAPTCRPGVRLWPCCQHLFSTADSAVCAVQVDDHYHFFLSGFPKQLWDTLPAELLPGSAAAREAARPAGDLSTAAD